MNQNPPYELLDFGNGRKLERFGDWILDRPSPSAEKTAPTNPSRWADSHLYFRLESKHQGSWFARKELEIFDGPLFDKYFQSKDRSAGQGDSVWRMLNQDFSWTITSGNLTYQLKCTQFGHIGLFPEHFQNWNRLRSIIAKEAQDGRDFRILSLFAYTGASSLCLSSFGAQVTQVEAAKNTAQWARQNSSLSQKKDLPIRWIVDDVQKFVEREIKRGKQYEGIVLDPPSFGHGTKGERWKIQQHLGPLLKNLALLASDSFSFVLLSAHSPGYGANELEQELLDSFQPKISRPLSTLWKGPLSIEKNSDALNQNFKTLKPSKNRLQSGAAVCYGNHMPE